MDWKLCIICQKVLKEEVQCPANSKRKDVGAGYSSFAANVEEFQKLGEIPCSLDFSLLDDGRGIVQTMCSNKAVWHKSCRLLFGNSKLERAKKRKCNDVEQDNFPENSSTTQDQVTPMKSRRCSSMASQSSVTDVCFFCEQSDTAKNLHAASTFEVDRKVRECAVTLKDNKLTAKLSGGDLIAIEAKYHAKCLVSLYNKARRLKLSVTKQIDDNSETELDLDELAFAELIAYIDEVIESEELAVLRLADLGSIYSLKQQEHGIEQGTVNKTRLKDRILEVFPDLTVHIEGRQILFALKHEIAGVLREAKRKDSDAWHLAKAANIIRKDMLKIKNSFDGTFTEDGQKDSVPASLKTLVGLMMKGPTTEFDPNDSQPCLTVSQLILFNCVTKYRGQQPEAKGSTHYVKFRECPLPLYTALKIHGATRDKSLIEAFYKLGLCISYDRVLSITTETANSVIERYERDKTVCPAKLRNGLFTTAAVDNVDHNTSSTSAQGSFHGTAISLVQHPTNENAGQERSVDTFDPASGNRSKRLEHLPAFYSEVHPMAEPPKNIFSAPANITTAAFTRSGQEYDNETDWLENVNQLFSKTELAIDDWISWAAYHASHCTLTCYQPAIISLLPMFTENAHSLAMIQHSMKVIKSAIKHVNPTQVPVIALDQPLFALAKQIQWTNYSEFDEDTLVVMLGGLHIELSTLNVIGKWLAGSGWTEAIADAGIATPGVADSFLKGKHLTRTRRAHQVTAACLHILMRKAYKSDAADFAVTNNGYQEFEDWGKERASTSPQFLYWSRVLDLELCYLRLVRSFREGNFQLYIEAIKDLLPWVFALDHQNYARWLSVHLKDMLELPTKHPEIHQEFTNGSFVVHKTQKLFSSIALDHAHEQVNAIVKGEGGAVGLTENPAALLRWMVSGPELSRMVEEFESGLNTPNNNKKHHEQTPAIQSMFLQDVRKLVSGFEESGNPFLDKGDDLTAMHTKDVMDATVVKSVRDVKDIGEIQFQSFIKERFVEQNKPITEPLKKNNLHLLSSQTKKVISKDKAKVKELKEDCALFSRLYIACQSRDGNLEDFFSFENQPWPPSLAQNGKLRGGQKADLVKCLINDITEESSNNYNIDAVILDGAVIVQMLPVKTARTFEEYFDTIFAPYILNQLEAVNRVDLVCIVYPIKQSKLGKASALFTRRGRYLLVHPCIGCTKMWSSANQDQK